MSDWAPVATAMLGTWPSQVATWGREALAAYLSELEARGLTPDAALTSIRMSDGAFPPSVAELAKLARRDPERPTFDECFAQLYGPGGVFGFKRSGVTVSPWVLAFVERHGRERLRLLEIDDPDESKWRRRELQQSWEAFLEATEGREVAALASGRRGQLGSFDPLRALTAARSATPPSHLELVP